MTARLRMCRRGHGKSRDCAAAIRCYIGLPCSVGGQTGLVADARGVLRPVIEGELAAEAVWHVGATRRRAGAPVVVAPALAGDEAQADAPANPRVDSRVGIANESPLELLKEITAGL